MTKHVEVVSVTNVVFTCDVCGQSAAVRRCYGCGKDICHHCWSFLLTDPWTGDDTGDYPPQICKACEARLDVYALPAQVIRDKTDEEIEALRVRWLADNQQRRESEDD